MHVSVNGHRVGASLARTRDGRPILTRADLESFDPRFVRAGTQDRFYCPIHGSDHQRSLALDPDSGAYYCHSCQARGTLREFWPTQDDANENEADARRPRDRQWAREHMLLERGRAIVRAQERAEEAKLARLTGDSGLTPPPSSLEFLAALPSLVEALRDPACPGARYLARRGLDARSAADLGAGYAAPNVWPGDEGRRAGRIVYPLANPITGAVISAVGRLCADADASWSTSLREQFKNVKQRKLAGCPAGVWPYAGIVAAREQGRPLVLVEGPADALALMQHPHAHGSVDVLALIGTANVVPVQVLRALRGVVVALDEDDEGRRAAEVLRRDLVIGAVHVALMPRGWLTDTHTYTGSASISSACDNSAGTVRVTDVGEVVQRIACRADSCGAQEWYGDVVQCVIDACHRLTHTGDSSGDSSADGSADSSGDSSGDDRYRRVAAQCTRCGALVFLMSWESAHDCLCLDCARVELAEETDAEEETETDEEQER